MKSAWPRAWTTISPNPFIRTGCFTPCGKPLNIGPTKRHWHPKAESRQAKAPAWGGPTGALPATLPGINIREALSALSIDSDTFRRILLRFVKDNADTLSQLKIALEREDWDVLQQLAHRLNGSAANIGAVGLQTAAQALETQCGQKAPSASLVHQLEIALNQVLQSLQILDDPTKIAPPEKPEQPIDPQSLQQLLAPLANAFEQADPVAIETQLQAVRQHLDTTWFQHLANQIDAYNYDEALKTLKGIAGKTGNPANGVGYNGKK
jgi:two-component system sensor histidine kinase/response regulator